MADREEKALLAEIGRVAGWINNQKNKGSAIKSSYQPYRPFPARKKRYKTFRSKKIVKKKEYCSLYIRNGFCSQTNCAYIHDRTTIKICSKFLQGNCTNERCRFQHQIIKEQMPVCSYFLRGVCTNDECPYAHVKVNPNAAVCQAFLKGYCEDGKKCKLKHTKECQSYNQNGYCPNKLNGRCKLQHNKDSQHGKNSKNKHLSSKKKKSLPRELELEGLDEATQNHHTNIENSILPNFIRHTQQKVEQGSDSDLSEEFMTSEESEEEEPEDMEMDFLSRLQETIPIPSFLGL